jgi:DNA-directed RNA polymerase specialized sigma24 family protein
MAPRHAVEYIKAFELPPDEEACIIEADVRRKSLVQIALARNMAVDTVKRCRRRGYQKIQDGISNLK